MTTTDLSQEPPGPAPVSARSAEADDRDGGGTDSAPASGRAGRFQRSPTAPSPAWAPWALKAAAGVIGVLALAGIGTASLARGSNGVPFRAASSLLTGGTQRWLSALAPPSPARPSRSRAPRADASAPAEAEAASAEEKPPQPAAADGGASADAGDAGSGITPDGKVVLNLANAEELSRLPSVGPKRAQAILALRARLKRFRRATDLLRVRGIGPKTLRRMRPHMVVDAPAPAAPAGDGGIDGGAK